MSPDPLKRYWPRSSKDEEPLYSGVFFLQKPLPSPAPESAMARNVRCLAIGGAISFSIFMGYLLGQYAALLFL